MTKLTTYFECVQYFKAKYEALGYEFDFIDNPYTGNQIVVINGRRSVVRRCGNKIPAIFEALRDACADCIRGLGIE